MQLCKAASRYRTESGSDRMLHSTCDRQSHPQEALWAQVECQHPVATALGSVTSTSSAMWPGFRAIGKTASVPVIPSPSPICFTDSKTIEGDFNAVSFLDALPSSVQPTSVRRLRFGRNGLKCKHVEL